MIGSFTANSENREDANREVKLTSLTERHFRLICITFFYLLFNLSYFIQYSSGEIFKKEKPNQTKKQTKKTP